MTELKKSDEGALDTTTRTPPGFQLATDTDVVIRCNENKNKTNARFATHAGSRVAPKKNDEDKKRG